MSIATEVWFPGADRTAAYSRQAHGAVIIDGREVGTTLACPHCGGHFLFVRGSGTKRHFCMGCNGLTCGAKECIACVPLEKRLAEIERKATRALRGI